VLGSFSEKSLETYSQLALSMQSSEYAESGEYDFTRCVRPDGTAYGTKGRRKGKESGAKEESPPKLRRSKKAAAEKPPVEPQKEEKGYKPKEKSEQSKGLKKLKERLFGGKKKDLDALIESPEQMRENAESSIARLRARMMEIRSKKDREPYQKAIDSAKQRLEVGIPQIETNKKFIQDLKANLPASVKASVDEETGEMVLTQKVGRHTIETRFNQNEGFNYRVNDSYNIGTVKNRKEQLRVTMAVRGQYDALVRSLPEGTVIMTSAYNGDGAGAARQRAYERIGFGKPEDFDKMFAMKKGGKMVPATGQQHADSMSNPGAVWFAESGEEGEKEDIKAWFQIVTGEDMGF
jgi:hypothetical protein